MATLTIAGANNTRRLALRNVRQRTTVACRQKLADCKCTLDGLRGKGWIIIPEVCSAAMRRAALCSARFV
jgi:hypothetical protein